MLYWAFCFLLLAVFAGALGFTGVAGASSWMAQVLFIAFLVMAVLSFARRATPELP